MTKQLLDRRSYEVPYWLAAETDFATSRTLGHPATPEGQHYHKYDHTKGYLLEALSYLNVNQHRSVIHPAQKLRSNKTMFC
jgi:hypothetical protein